MASTLSRAPGPPKGYLHFWNWVEENMVWGVDGLGNPVQYVPYHELEKYWDRDRIAAFPGIDDKAYLIEDIRSRLLRVLSILVWISKCSKPRVYYLDSFYRTDIDDHKLPILPATASRISPYSQYANNVPEPFPRQEDGAAVWKAFNESQWQFCPIVFLPNGRIIEKFPQRPLDVRHIRPVTVLQELPGRSNGATKLLKVLPHQSSGLPKVPIVIKEYAKDELDYEFKKEKQAYTTIRNRSINPSITEKLFLRYHGSFLQGDKCVILLEYADEGSLLEFFRANQIPSDLEEAYQLWKDLSDLFSALDILHNGEQNVGVHQDLKPANIFVFKRPNKEYGFQFKLGDFGLCSVTDWNPAGDTVGTDNHATKMYSAPELCHTDSNLEDIPREVTSEADIWSLGCILLETGVWMHRADRGRLKFLKARQAATVGKTKFCGAGYQGAFHDGHKPLDVVRNAHERFADGNAHEQLSSSIMAFIVKEMLVGEDGKRPGAEKLKRRFDDVLEGHQSIHILPAELTPMTSSISLSSDSVAAENKRRGKQPERPRLTIPVTGVTHNSHQHRDADPIDGRRPFERPSHLHPRHHVDDERITKVSRPQSNELGGPSSASGGNYTPGFQGDRTTTPQERPVNVQPSNHPHVTIPEVLMWMYQHKIDRLRELPGMKGVLEHVANRDQVFIIDNSPSMEEYWPQVTSTCHALCYVVKRVGPNGFDVAFTSNPASLETMQRCSKLLKRSGPLQLNRPKQGMSVCRMEHVLSTLLPIVINNAINGRDLMSRVRKRKPSGINIYVLTNGVWEGAPPPDANGHTTAEADGVENAIKLAVDMLHKKMKPRIYLSIQLIRFGRYAIGERRLSWLDDNIKERTRGWDIVDTTHHEGASIWKMITGPMSRAEDEANDVAREYSRRNEG